MPEPKFIDDAAGSAPKFIDDAETPSRSSSMDVGVGTTKPMRGKLEALLKDRERVTKGMTPMPMSTSILTVPYRAITGEEPPSWVPEPTVEGFTKGLSNLVLGPVRGGSYLGMKTSEALGLSPVEKAYRWLYDKTGGAARGITELTGQQEDSPTRSQTGQLMGEVAPTMAAPITRAASVPGFLATTGRLVRAPAEGALAAMMTSPQEQARTPEQYAQAQAQVAKLGALLGAGGGTLREVAEPLAKIFRKTKPDMLVADLPQQMESRLGGRAPGDVFQDALASAEAADRAKAGQRLNALRKLDPQGYKVELPQLRKSVKETVGKQLSLGSDRNDPLVSELRSYWRRMRASENKGATRALDLRQRLSAAIDSTEDRYKKSQLLELKSALDADLEQNPEFGGALKEWGDIMKPWVSKKEGATALSRAKESATPEEDLAKLWKRSPERGKIVYSRLDEQGRNAAKAIALDDLVSASEGDPLKLAKAIKEGRRKGSLNILFEGEDAKKLAGFEKLAKYAYRTGHTGVGAAGAGLVLTGAPGMWAGTAPFGAVLAERIGGGPARKAAYKLFQTEAGQKLLLDAERISEKSPEFANLLKRLPAFGAETQSE